MSAEIVEDKSAQEAPAPNKKKKLIIIGAATAAALTLGGGGAAFFMGGKSAKTEAHAEEAAADEGHGEGAAKEGEGGKEGEGKGKFVDVPTVSVNLRSPDGSPRFLKLHLMLVPGPKTTDTALKDKLPVVLDAYQPFLRELRPEDLGGSAAVFRLKEELMVRATRVLGPGMVKEVLIQDLIQQ
ncbi:flagellar basal body-associated FliL family protein [Sphingomonas sp. TDK1]|uniref:flagellar basal body-associated FliL family protein n=1 Tax=Sphingomonas sp. TDK1 TaxID=453247 RepID=UPI0007D983E9|nr:flagellar basal body-associated FliL family protein [Sphingomonas sp. TDK1]OAN57305.1 flagellar basal body protein FliL [Sphingomonas sp. TDK1]